MNEEVKEETEAEEEQVETAETMEEAEMVEEEKVEEPLEMEEEPTEETLAAEEEVKPPPREEKLREEEIVEERIYTVPLRKAWIAPPNKRAPRAIRILKSFITRHMKLEARKEEGEEEPKKLIVSNEVNERIWSRGIEKPPRKIRVRAAKDKEGNVTIYLAEGD